MTGQCSGQNAGHFVLSHEGQFDGQKRGTVTMLYLVTAAIGIIVTVVFILFVMGARVLGDIYDAARDELD